MVFADQPAPARFAYDLTEDGNAKLVFGKPDFHQAVVPFDGTKVTTEAPRDLAITGIVTSDGIDFQVKRAQLLPYGCAKTNGANVSYVPVKKSEMGLVLWGDVNATVKYTGGNAAWTVALKSPDSTTTATTTTNDKVIDQNESLRDIPFCFTVPAPGTGSYQFQLNSYVARSKAPSVFGFEVK